MCRSWWAESQLWTNSSHDQQIEAYLSSKCSEAPANLSGERCKKKPFTTWKHTLATWSKWLRWTQRSITTIHFCFTNNSQCCSSPWKNSRRSTKQLAIYFVSEALSGSKLHYSELEKIAYAVIMSARKLRHYFESHKIIVVTNQPLHDLFYNREASARISKWHQNFRSMW